MAERTNALTKARDAVWHPTSASLRFLALLGVLGNAGIVATGGAVRVTKSGLGCPEWPKCTGDSLTPTHSPDHGAVNMAIEFGNRMLTFLVLAVGVLVFVAAWRLRPRRRDLVWWAAAQPLSVVAQAVIGGIVVLTKLHPASVSLHFLVSPALLIFCVALWARASEGDDRPRHLVAPYVRNLSRALVAAAAAVLIAGTVVTGTGPHAGDADSRRYGFNIENVARVHSGLAWITVALTVVLLVTLIRTGAPTAARRRAVELVAIELAQGALGYIQYFMGVPAPLVVLHMLGAVLMWIAALRILFALRDRGPVPATEPVPAQKHQAPQPA
ncbi:MULTISPECIES: COX15/CtaA family protein [Actinomadura]|uniref:Heme A synthase n=1 Tax=Actinomadura yumaensis TaxID=111807 RepID=A0ABW2CWT5_9ACTN|nr:COX15/CtaA family protein [Actinomadura sp. J1-007]MWK39182.1 heme A synthase [Actinomadura sp. J1-007]